MDFLVDTHAVIWYITDDNQLLEKAKKVIKNPQNKCFVSVASYWEIAIKYSKGRLELNTDLDRIFSIIEESGFEILPITPKHILKNAGLEFHHQDPFDRIIIARAIVENLTLISKDEQFSNMMSN